MSTSRFHKFALAAVLMSSLAAVLPAQAQSDPDSALASQVKAALLQVPAFQDRDVDLNVSASNGQVLLSGWVTYANDPEAAVKVAARVSGVKAVTATLHTWSSESDYRV